jgi:hypothetical protein
MMLLHALKREGLTVGPAGIRLPLSKAPTAPATVARHYRRLNPEVVQRLPTRQTVYDPFWLTATSRPGL